MTLFFISATFLVLLSLGWLLVGVFSTKANSTDQEAVNITLARERRETLDVALAEGAIDQTTFDYEREQLEHDLAADLSAEGETTHRKGGQLGAAVLICTFIPIAAGALYLHIGNPSAITQARTAPAAEIEQAQSVPDMEQMLPEMEARLTQQPEDVDGWRLLGRSYLSMGEYTGARRAFEQALTLDEQHVPTITQLAESIAMMQQGDLSGEPLLYIKKANALDPDNEHALWLLSIAQQQAGDHTSAMQGFDRLIDLAQGNVEALNTINQMRSRSVDAMSGANVNAGDLPRAESPATNQNNASATQTASIDVTVDLSAQAREAASDEQVVFVYATATNGPPMPLAVSRLNVKDLPATITLDDSMAMVPNMTLSAFPMVTVGARISSTGEAIAQSGDWFTEAAELAPASVNNIELTIDQQKP